MRHALVTLSALAVIISVLALPPGSADAQPDESASPWRDVAERHFADGQEPASVIRPAEARALLLDADRLTGQLDAGTAPILLPHPDGSLIRVRVGRTQVMAAELAADHPEIGTWAGISLDQPATTVRITTSPLGLSATVRGPDGVWYIDPQDHQHPDVHLAYRHRDLGEDSNTQYSEEVLPSSAEVARALADANEPPARQGEPGELLTYRLGIVSTPAYAANFGGAANVTAAKVTLINRVSQIYEDELSIRLELIAEQDALNLDTPAEFSGADGPCGDIPCYTLDDCFDGLDRGTFVMGQLVGAGSFDIGHFMTVGDGGVAGLGVVGGPEKAVGCTALTPPSGDAFAVDYVAHEMGHQFGGNHTWDGAGCGAGQYAFEAAVEPGSGSTIQAYAGICPGEDLQTNSDPVFSQRSRTEILTFVDLSLPDLNEVVSVSFRGFNGGDSFTLSYQGQPSPLITRGSNYNAAGIEAAVDAIPGFPAGADVDVFGLPVDPFDLDTPPDDLGFRLEFGGSVEGVDLDDFTVTVAGAEAIVGETIKGGPVTNGGTSSATGNTTPDVTAAEDVTIPYQTPFSLTAQASDVDGDTLTYTWEQNDSGDLRTLSANDQDNGALFRVFGVKLDNSVYVGTEYNTDGVNTPGTSPTRYFPDLPQIIAGGTNAVTGDCPSGNVDCYSERLPTAAYAGPMNFRVTARDNAVGGAGVSHDDTVVSLAPGSGPFLVTSQDTPGTLIAGASQAVSWDVAGTDLAPIGVNEVQILLSTDGGITFDTELGTSDNDGTAQVTLPVVATDEARIMVAAVDNVFFAVNDADQLILASGVTDNAPGGTVTLEAGEAIAIEDDILTVTVVDFEADGSDLAIEVADLIDGLGFTLTSTTPDGERPGIRTYDLEGDVPTEVLSQTASVSATSDGADLGATSFTIEVVDSVAPVISDVPADFEVEAVSTPVSVDYDQPSASDAVDGDVPVSCVPASGSDFAAGATVVDCQAVDDSGNSAEAAFTVTVIEVDPPVTPTPTPTPTPTATPSPTPTPTPPPTPSRPEVRLLELPDAAEGNSDLSVAVSQLRTPTIDDGTRFAQDLDVEEVLLASEVVFADALSSGSLQRNLTLLLTDPAELEPAVEAELQRLDPTIVRILGGDQAVSDAVVDELDDLGFGSIRTFGPTRLETAAAIARLGIIDPDTGFLARAFPAPSASDETQAFADSLALGGWAAATDGGITLTQTEVLSGTAADALDAASLDSLSVIGGVLAISEETSEAAATRVESIVRIAGQTRFETAVAIAQARGFTPDDPAPAVVLIEGQAANAWAAGFTGAGLSADLDAPVLLSNGDTLPQETVDALQLLIEPDGDTGLVCLSSASACGQAAFWLGIDT